MHVDAHYLLAFSPCGQHDVYPYPVSAHMASGCHPGVHYTVDADTYPEFLAIIYLLVWKALLLAVITQGFQAVLGYASQRSPLVSDKPEAMPIQNESSNHDATEEEVELPPSRDSTLTPERPTRLSTVEERLLRLQTEFTQLAPSLLTTTTGLYRLKDCESD